MFDRLKSISDKLAGGEANYPAVKIDQELAKELQSRLDGLTDDQGGPLLLVRPSKENESISASTEMLETFHDPRINRIGIGDKFSLTTTDAHIHAHEIWYNDGLMQFFLRPATQIDANQFRRQVRKNYPDAQIQDVSQRFLDFEPGDYVSIATLQLNREFYFPVKSGLCQEDVIEEDPYGGITSDMVVEEDQTRDGTRVDAKDCRIMVQTTFEPARDVWSMGRPFGVDTADVAMGLKEGQLKGSMVKGYEVRNPSARRKHTAKMLNELQGKKGFYMTVRIISISPYAEIAKRRCRTVANDYEQFYRSVSKQKFIPEPADEGDISDIMLAAAERTHEYTLRDRISGNKILQPVEALSSVAHLPNEDINTPVVDFAKQDTGPGTPSASSQIEEEKQRQEEDTGERGRKTSYSPEGGGGGKPTENKPKTGGASSNDLTATNSTAGANDLEKNESKGSPIDNNIESFDKQQEHDGIESDPPTQSREDELSLPDEEPHSQADSTSQEQDNQTSAGETTAPNQQTSAASETTHRPGGEGYAGEENNSNNQQPHPAEENDGADSDGIGGGWNNDESGSDTLTNEDRWQKYNSEEKNRQSQRNDESETEDEDSDWGSTSRRR